MSKGNLSENSPNNSSNSDVAPGSGNNDGSTDSGWHTGHINGNTFRNKEVKYRIINGMAIFEGDIILARTPQELERLSPEAKVPSEHQPTVKPIVRAIVRAGDEYRWLRGEIPYTIQSTLPNPQRVRDAIRHWEERTPIRFILRTNSNAKYYPNYVSFIRYIPGQDENPEEVYHCSSPVGMQGSGEQNIILSDQCTTGAAIHEIGHTIGLWHEQSREDRDDFIRILWDNIDPNMIHNFSQHIVDGDDIGEYDYCSIMHYDVLAFSKNRQDPTIEALRQHPCGSANRLGMTDVLSDGDISAATELYANPTPIVARNADGRLEVFTIRPDGKLYRKQQKSANSNEWEPSNTKQGNQDIQNWSPLGLEQQFFSSGQRPAIVRSRDGRLDVYWLKDSTHYHAYQSTPNSSWSTTSETDYGVGVDFDGDPVVAQNPVNGSIEVFMVHEEVESNNFRLHHMTRDGAILPSLGGRWSPNARPAIAINADNRLEAFMVDPDRQLQRRKQEIRDSSNWSEDWSSLGSPYLGDPAADLDFNGRICVFVVNGNNKQLEYWWQTRAGDSMNWSSESLEGHWSPRRRPAIAHSSGMLDVFMVGTDGRLYHRWQTAWNNNRWDWFRNWDPIGKEVWPLSSNPAVGQNDDGRLEVFMVGKDGRFYHRWQTAPGIGQWGAGNWALL